jgi:hypothetical protein
MLWIIVLLQSPVIMELARAAGRRLTLKILIYLAAVIVSLNGQSPIVPFGSIAPQIITFCRYLGTRFTSPAGCFDQRRTVLGNSCTEVSSENIVRLQSLSLWQRTHSKHFCL